MEPNKCKNCNGLSELRQIKPECFVRWRNTTPLYYWVQCGDTYPCKIGDCCLTNKEAIESWNNKEALESK